MVVQKSKYKQNTFELLHASDFIPCTPYHNAPSVDNKVYLGNDFLFVNQETYSRFYEGS